MDKVGILVLRGGIKAELNHKMCILEDIPQMKILNMVISILMCFCACLPLFHLKLEHYRPNKAACHPRKCDVNNDIKTISDSMSQIYCHFLALSNRTLLYNSKCINMWYMY